MRASRLAVCLLMCLFGSGVIACSGSDPRAIPIDAPQPPPDTPSNPPPDAGVTCAQRGTLNATTVLDFSTAGQVQGRVPANGTQLTVAVAVTTNAARTMGFIIGQRNNTGVFATATGKAGRFEKPPATGLYAMDTDASSDASFGFGIDVVDGITVNPDNTVSIHPTQVALLDPVAGGSVRIDTWTPAAAPGGTSTIAATFSNARFKGFNILANGSRDPAGNGCDILVQNLQFKNLSVKWQTAPFPANVTARPPPPPDFAQRTLDGAAVLRAEIALDP